MKRTQVSQTMTRALPIPQRLRKAGAATVLCALALATPVAAASQSPFAPVRYVNDRPITNYEVEQKVEFLRFLGSAGDLRDTAIELLTEDRLYADAAERRGLSLTPEEIANGMAEFAARGGLETEALLKLLNERGISTQTFRDFVSAGLLWRKVVGAQFGGPSTVVTDRDVDLALAPEAERPGLRVLYSEIYLPARDPQELEKSKQLADQIVRRINGFADFAAQAREYSVAPTRNVGGRVNWVDLAQLPPPLQQALRPLAPGDLAGPISAGNVVALFQLRGIEESTTVAPKQVTVDYASYLIPGIANGTAQGTAAALRNRVTTCDDLYAVAKGQPDAMLDRVTLPMSQVPGDVGLELGKLDVGEVSTALTGSGGQSLRFLMLCGRTVEQPAPAAVPGEEITPPTPEEQRNAMRSRLINQQVQDKADGLLAELKAEAIIRQP